MKPGDLREVRDEFFPDRDFPGGFTGQCVDKHSSDPSLLEYDIPADVSRITIRFTPKDSKAEFTLLLKRQPGGSYKFAIQEVVQGVAQVTTYTPSPIPTITLTPSATFTPSLTPIYSPTSNIRYITNAQQVNVRACAGTQCNVITTLDYGEIVVVLSASGGWVQVRLPDGQVGYISASLTSPNRPPGASPTIAPTATNFPRQTRYTTANVNLRSCAGTQCQKTGSMVLGDSFEVTGQATAPDGSLWFSLVHNRQTMWVISEYTSKERPYIPPTRIPAVQQPPAQQVPQQPPAQQPPPALPTSAPPPQQPAGFTCDCSKTCPAMASCQEAYFQLNQCGCSRRDGDGDGVPCEDICPGG
jgi:uncharacterized protein YgiM (DUF1202 family)